MTTERERLFAGPEVGLKDVLSSRDRRVRVRAETLARLGRPTITLTLVMPGPVKHCLFSRQIAAEARNRLGATLSAQDLAYEVVLSTDLPTGPETLISVASCARSLKVAMVALEDSHPLGRLWDLDVHDTDGSSLSRRDIGHPPRPCLVCGAVAHGCTRSRAHSLQSLYSEMERRWVDWQATAGKEAVGRE